MAETFAEEVVKHRNVRPQALPGRDYSLMQPMSITMDIVERLKQPVMLHSNAEQTNAERREAAAEIERLRTAVLSTPCPGGGFNGMPKDAEANVALCIKHGVCGCQYGDALRAYEQSE